MSQRKATKHKQTVHCPVKDCKYTSRQWVFKSEFKFSQKQSTYSTKCPIHNRVLTPKI